MLQSYINGIFTSCFVKTSSVSVYSQGTTPPLGQDVSRYPISKALSFVNLANDVAAYHSCCAINLRRCCQVSEHCIVPELSSETKRTPNYVIGATKWTKCAEIFVVSRVWNVGHLETTEYNYSCEFLNRKRTLFLRNLVVLAKTINRRWSLVLELGCM